MPGGAKDSKKTIEFIDPPGSLSTIVLFRIVLPGEPRNSKPDNESYPSRVTWSFHVDANTFKTPSAVDGIETPWDPSRRSSLLPCWSVLF